MQGFIIIHKKYKINMYYYSIYKHTCDPVQNVEVGTFDGELAFACLECMYVIINARSYGL